MSPVYIPGFLCFILIGVCLGLIGGGGSMLTLPVLVYLFGLNPVTSTAYSLFIIGTTSLVGSLRYMQKRQINYHTALIFSIPSFFTVFVTRRYVIPAIPDPVFSFGTASISKGASLMVFFAFVMLAASVFMLNRRKLQSQPSDSAEINKVLLAIDGGIIGALTGFVGVGGGFLIIPALVLLAHLPMKIAVGTSLLIIAINALTGFLGDLPTYQISWPFLLSFTALSVIGILFGSYLSQFIASYTLQKAFGWFMFSMGFYILLRETFAASALLGQQTTQPSPTELLWNAPDTSQIDHQKNAALIRYGRKLVINTAYYLGPNGKVAHLSNGMNCQNCHLEAGTKPWGNNFGAVASTYPKLLERSGVTQTIVQRVNDCFERSLNGRVPDSNGREMKAIVAYIRFIGQSVPKGQTPKGVGTWKLAYLDRAADPVKGKILYQQKCITCHGPTGQGQRKPDDSEYVYPPLWGVHSYNTGASLYRLSRFAGYIKANMPLGARWNAPQLTDEQAWDIAAYINSRPHPVKVFAKDWPNLRNKPVDYPFGPFADSFSEQQHKYGPYKPIEQARKQQAATPRTST